MSTDPPDNRRQNMGPVVPYAGFGPAHEGRRPADAAHLHDAHHPDVEAKPAEGGWRHRLLMLVCCIPMLILVVVLVASGAAGGGAIVFALLCVGMMAVMMFAMPGEHRH